MCRIDDDPFGGDTTSHGITRGRISSATINDHPSVEWRRDRSPQQAHHPNRWRSSDRPVSIQYLPEYLGFKTTGSPSYTHRSIVIDGFHALDRPSPSCAWWTTVRREAENSLRRSRTTRCVRRNSMNSMHHAIAPAGSPAGAMRKEGAYQVQF